MDGSQHERHPCNKSPSAIAVTIVAAIAAAIAVSRAAAIAGVRAYESVPLYAVPLQRFHYIAGDRYVDNYKEHTSLEYCY